MTINKGEVWGRPAPKNINPQNFDNDSELAKAALLANQDNKELVARLETGDLLSSLGNPQPNAPGHLLPMDLGLLISGSKKFPFVAHCYSGLFNISDEPFVAMNATLLKKYQLGPKAHPNDGLLDTISSNQRLPLNQKLMFLKRAKLGLDFSHPNLKLSRVKDIQVSFKKPRRIYCDGVSVCKASEVSVQLISDAFLLLI